VKIWFIIALMSSLIVAQFVLWKSSQMPSIPGVLFFANFSHGKVYFLG